MISRKCKKYKLLRGTQSDTPPRNKILLPGDIVIKTESERSRRGGTLGRAPLRRARSCRHTRSSKTVKLPLTQPHWGLTQVSQLSGPGAGITTRIPHAAPQLSARDRVSATPSPALHLVLVTSQRD